MKATMIRAAMLIWGLTILLWGGAAAADERPGGDAQTQRSHIDLVIALDTSNSMDGLINSARQKLWDIVNELATAKPTPILRVGLISFGNDGYQEAGWTRVDLNLTDDLDSVYDKLMGLSTNGGSEYVGRAIHVAHKQMRWRPDRKTLKLIFVAGNESADQDREFPSMQAAGAIIQDDVIVNTIYCGQPNDSISEGWRQVALRADGQFSAIAPDGGAVVINTPYDDELARLSQELNKTYLAYGAKGKVARERQARQDESAKKLSGSAGASRAAAKSSALYRNDDWDLVDAQAEGVALNQIAKDDLPQELQGLSPAEQQAVVDKKAKERKQIQDKIQELNQKRNAYIQQENNKNRDAKKGGAFDEALRDSLRKQAKRKNINF
jgi:hypothetical protein